MRFDLEKLALLPLKPGVYLMKDEHSKVLYVGKAKNLRRRVRQYFVPGRDGRSMVPYLVSHVVSIDTVVVFSEKEALLLENNLIKIHQPKYNALLKDDKTYIAIKVTTKDKWPAAKIVRYRGEPKKDGLYFGPYTSAESARETLDLLHLLFPLRQCSDQELIRRTRPCLLYQIKRCIAPCVNLCSKKEYESQVERTIKFLRGDTKDVLKALTEEMESFSSRLEFEKAAEVHEKIKHITKTLEKQYVDRPLGIDADVIATYREADECVLVQMIYRGGKLIASNPYSFQKVVETDSELCSFFIVQHYQIEKEIPPTLIVPEGIESVAAIEEILKERKGIIVSLHVPKKGEKKVLLDMAKENAKSYFSSHKNEKDQREKTLLEMEERLELLNYPYRIECFDNSHFGGAETVSAMVVFQDGLADKKNYRLYRSKTSQGDDYGAMHEALLRRYKKGKEEGNLPDLLIVDGGKGQLNVAKKVLESLNIVGIDLIGLSKEEGRHDKGLTAEKIFLLTKETPLLLDKTSPILFFLQKIRDEAHRFVIQFQKKRREKKLFYSSLDEVPGIGEAKKKALLLHFGSVEKIMNASDDELKAIKGISLRNIEDLRRMNL